jgi:hypothetical protein
MKLVLPLVVVTRVDEAGLAWLCDAKDGREYPAGVLEDFDEDQVVVEALPACDHWRLTG